MPYYPPSGGGSASSSSAGLAGTGNFYILGSAASVLPNSKVLAAGTNVTITTDASSIFVSASAVNSPYQILSKTSTSITLTNTTAQTTVFQTTVSGGLLGTFNIVRMTMIGGFINSTGANQNFNVLVRYGSSNIFATGGVTLASNVTHRAYQMDIVLGGVGTTSSQVASGQWLFATSGTGGATANLGTNSQYGGDLVISEDSTVTQNFDVLITMATAATTMQWTTSKTYLELLS